MDIYKPKWRIYYGDGSTYSGDPYWAPATDIQAIVMEDSTSHRGYRTVTSKDAFVYRENCWWGCDDAGMWDYLLNHAGPKAVVFGRTMARGEDYFKIVHKAHAEGLGNV